MNREKISDFVDVWAKTIGLIETRYINIIKSDIVKRCMMYEKSTPTVSTKDDNCKAYLIKAVNGEYSLEDFFLNRLMLGLREVSFSGALEGNAGDYTAHNKTLNINVGLLDSTITNKATRHSGLQGKNVQIINKTIEHELGHCFKSLFNNGFKAPIGNGRQQDDVYKELIKNLSKFKNGKYANQIKGLQELNLDEYSDVIKTGVNDSKENYQHDYRVKWIDELLNETEALELTNSNEVHEIWPLQDEDGKKSKSGNYVNVYNYISKYATFTGYGSILKSLLGNEDTFSTEYISSTDVFKKFDEEYADIVQDVWGLNPDEFKPMQCLYVDFHNLVNGKYFNENIMLKLDEFLAKCYERKVEKTISKSNGVIAKEEKEEILKEIENFQSRLTTNDDEQKREQLAHNIVFSNIKNRINQLTLQNDGQEHFTETTEKVENKSPKSKKQAFVEGFISAYDITEEEHQKEKRVEDEEFDINRVKQIIETKGLNHMLTSDLDGKWIGTPSQPDFKVQYSQKQVSAMARLLKAAKKLTNDKQLNPEGRNFLAEFANVPDIDYRLKQLREDFNDENSYMSELRQKARECRKNGVLQSAIEATEISTITVEINDQAGKIKQITKGKDEISKGTESV